MTDDVINGLSLKSKFFAENPLRPVPTVSKEEFRLGSLLGQGVFGSVYEVLSLRPDFTLGSSTNTLFEDKVEKPEHTGSPPPPPPPLTTTTAAPTSESHPSKYVVKLLRRDLRAKIRTEAILDLVCEAEYLARLSHPNIIRLRATVGQSGFSSFMLILDRLDQTLSTKLDEWKHALQGERKAQFGGGPAGMLCRKKPAYWRQHQGLRRVLFHERLLAASHVARALRHLHSKSLMFRDVKPQNVGLDYSGQWKLFDFGLCKELKPKDLVHPPDGYLTSGVVGSRRYM